MTGSKENEVGYKKPPKHSRFKPGQVANPGGKTSEQKRMEMDNLQLALQAKNRFLRALVAKQEDQSTDEVLDGMSGSDILRLIKDAEDRVSGTPRQSVDLSSEDGSMSPKDASDAVLMALRAKHGPDAD